MLTRDLAYDLLSNPRRRFVISHLEQRETSIDLNSLAKEVAAWENDQQVSDLSAQQTKRAYVSLHQTHIPKLEEANIIEYDVDTGQVRLRNKARQLHHFIPDSESETSSWPRLYIAAAIIGGLAYLVVRWFSLTEFGYTLTGFLVILLFLGISLVQYHSNRQQNNLSANFIQQRGNK